MELVNSYRVFEITVLVLGGASCFARLAVVIVVVVVIVIVGCMRRRRRRRRKRRKRRRTGCIYSYEAKAGAKT